MVIEVKFGKKKNRLTTCKWLVKRFLDGRGDRTWTCGILVPNQALYQTELRLDFLSLSSFVPDDVCNYSALLSICQHFFESFLKSFFMFHKTAWLSHFSKKKEAVFRRLSKVFSKIFLNFFEKIPKIILQVLSAGDG